MEGRRPCLVGRQMNGKSCGLLFRIILSIRDKDISVERRQEKEIQALGLTNMP